MCEPADEMLDPSGLKKIKLSSDDNDCNIVEQAKLTLESELSGKISLQIVFDINVFKKLKMETSQLPPGKGSVKIRDNSGKGHYESI